jgi:hypothetical protein
MSMAMENDESDPILRAREEKSRRSAEPPILSVPVDITILDAARRFAALVHPTGETKPRMIGSAEALLQILSDSSSVETAIFLNRSQLYERRAVDTFLLWSTPVLMREHAAEMDRLTQQHAESFDSYGSYFDSLLHIVDPRTCSSAEVLRHQLWERYHWSGATRMLPLTFSH